MYNELKDPYVQQLKNLYVEQLKDPYVEQLKDPYVINAGLVNRTTGQCLT